MTVQLPFVYKTGAAATSLLASAITGQGAAIATPRDSHAMVLRKGGVVPLTLDEAGNAAMGEYADHFKTYYDEFSVDRHVTTLMRGGRQAYLDYDPEGLYLTSESPPSSWPSNHLDVYNGAVAARSRFCELAFGLGENMERAYAEMARYMTNAFADGDLELVYDVSATREQIGYTLATNGADNTGGSGLGNAGVVMHPYQSSTQFYSPVAANNMARDVLKLGYVCVCARWHLLGPGQNGTQPGDPWRMVVWRRKLKAPSRTAMITVSGGIINMLATTINSKQEWKMSVINQRIFIDSWVLNGTGASQRLVLSVGADKLNETYSATPGNYSVYSSLGVYKIGLMQDSAPSMGSLFGSATDFLSQSRTCWTFPPSLVTTSSSLSPGQTITFTRNSDSLSSTLLAGRPPRTGLLEWTGVTDSNLAVNICKFGASRVPFAADLTTHPVIQYRLKLAALPALVTLSPDLVPEIVGQGLRTRLTAADLRAILLAVELQSGDSTASLRGSLTTDERNFYGVTDDQLVAPPGNVLAQTGVYQTASEAGQSINNELLIEKDPDDSDSVSVTFKQADTLAAKFRSHAILNGRRGITVVGPTDRYAVPSVTVYAATIEGRHVFTDSTFLIELEDEDLSAVYAAIRQGRRFSFPPNFTTSTEYLTYASEFGDNGYPQIYDRYTMEVFGASYGSITSGAGTQGKIGDTTWSVHGQLDKGFLKDPSYWTPEFWLITAATKGWKLESVLGTLLTNPYGVGSLSQKVLKAASHEAG